MVLKFYDFCYVSLKESLRCTEELHRLSTFVERIRYQIVRIDRRAGKFFRHFTRKVALSDT